MTIRQRLRDPEPTLSFELFPPRSPAAEDALAATLEEFVALEPDFVSVTYGASGSTQDASRSVVRSVAQTYGVPALAHLTCVGQSRSDLEGVIAGYLADGVRDFLALRGDPPKGEGGWRPHPDGLVYAADLVTMVRDVSHAHAVQDVCVGVAAFPAQHSIPRFRQTALDVLKSKQDAGADFAITQVFYDLDEYTGLVAEAARQGIEMPIIPEVMPLVSAQRAIRAGHITGVSTPQDLLASLHAADTDEDAHERGVEYAARLSRQLLDAGAPGIHVITFNRHDAPLDLVRRIGLRGTPDESLSAQDRENRRTQ